MRVLHFEIPLPPSLKNSVVIGRGRMWKSSAVKVAMRTIRDTIRREIDKIHASYPSEGPIFGGNRIKLQIAHNVPLDKLLVWVEDLGQFPTSGRTGRKRDLQNLQDTLCDAMEGVVYKNDNQIDKLSMWRVTEE